MIATTKTTFVSDAYPCKALADVKQASFSSLLDFARWSAAGLVFVAHLRDPLFLGYRDLPRYSETIPVKVWYFVTGWYYDAVLVFFVLSGFLVGGLSLARLAEARYSTAEYAIDRVSRLFLPYVPVLFITYLLDKAGAVWFAASGLYDHKQLMLAQKLGDVSFSQHNTIENLFLNFLMLQNFHADPLGSNSPLWSLSAEFWFYVVFGIAMATLRGPLPRKILGVLALSLITLGLGWNFPPLLALWCIGIACAYVPSRKHIERPLIAVSTFALLLIVSRLYAPFLAKALMLKYGLDFCAACAFGWVLVSMRNVRSSLLARSANMNRSLASFSYSLYLLHFPLMLFMLGAFYSAGFAGIGRGYLPTDFVGLFIYGAVIVMVYAVSYAFSRLTEGQTGKCRQILRTWFDTISIESGRQPKKTA